LAHQGLKDGGGFAVARAAKNEQVLEQRFTIERDRLSLAWGRKVAAQPHRARTFADLEERRALQVAGRMRDLAYIAGMSERAGLRAIGPAHIAVLGNHLVRCCCFFAPMLDRSRRNQNADAQGDGNPGRDQNDECP
jgi:hypothetical protein